MSNSPNETSDWQSLKTLAESMAYMLDQQISCDVKFIVGSEESHAEIEAHKYMLISRSCVFHTMFLGLLREEDTVRVTDIQPEIFRQMLRYMYTEHTDILSESVFELLNAAKKYFVAGLVLECTDYILENLNPTNACDVLEQAHAVDEAELFEKAFNIIADDGDEILKSSCFSDLSENCVQKVVSSDDLRVTSEETVFEAMKVWATKKRARNENMTLREALGDLLYLIRFPLMSSTYFKENVFSFGILNLTEKNEILEHYVFPGKEKQLFNNNVRKTKGKPVEVWRMPQQAEKQCQDTFTFGRSRHPQRSIFGPLPGAPVHLHALKHYDGVKVDAIAFFTSRIIKLHGFRIWGRDDGVYKYKLSFALYCTVDDKDHLLTNGTQEVETTTSEKSYIVNLPNVIKLKGWMKYTIELRIDEGASYYSSNKSTDGKTNFEVAFQDASFIFRSSERDTNGTSPTTGQIPCLLCSFS